MVKGRVFNRNITSAAGTGRATFVTTRVQGSEGHQPLYLRLKSIFGKFILESIECNTIMSRPATNLGTMCKDAAYTNCCRSCARNQHC